MKNKESVNVKAEIKSIFEFKIKKETSKLLGQTMAKLTIEDEFGDQISLTVFPDGLKYLKSDVKDRLGNKYKLDEGIAIAFVANVNHYEDEIGLIYENLIQCVPPPAPPKNLKIKKKVSKKSSDAGISFNSIKLKDDTEVIESIDLMEDELFNEGLISLEEDED